MIIRSNKQYFIQAKRFGTTIPRRYLKRSQKFQFWYTGPYVVVQKLGAVNYLIKKNDHAQGLVAHVDKLKAYQDMPQAEARRIKCSNVDVNCNSIVDVAECCLIAGSIGKEEDVQEQLKTSRRSVYICRLCQRTIVGYKVLQTHEYRCKKKMARMHVVNSVQDVTAQMKKLQSGEVTAVPPTGLLGVTENAAPKYYGEVAQASCIDTAPEFEEEAAPDLYGESVPVAFEGGALAFTPFLAPELTVSVEPADGGGDTPLRDEVTSPITWVRETRGWEIEPREKGTNLEARLEAWKEAYQVHIEEGRIQVEEVKACTRCGFREGVQEEQMDWRLVKFKKAEEAVRWIKTQIKESEGKVGVEELCKRTKERYMEIGPSTHVRTIIMGIMVGMETDQPATVKESNVIIQAEEVQVHRV